MNCLAVFYGGPLDGREDIVLPLDAWGDPPGRFMAPAAPAAPWGEDTPSFPGTTQHVYRLTSFVGPAARYVYEGET